MTSKMFSFETAEKHAEMLCNRALKNHKKLKTKFDRDHVEVFRIYHWDIPEVRCVLDWYKGHLVLGEYTREQTEGLPYLETIAKKLAEGFKIPLDHIHLKKRTTRKEDGPRYERLEHKEEYLEVSEGHLKFLVNLNDYLDTGLFSDHRKTRGLFEEESRGKDVLNLYCYTGSFTVYAAKGGAKTTTSVDMSPKYLSWLEANLELNDLQSLKHKTVQAEGLSFLSEAKKSGANWDLIFLDPPSYSTSKGGKELLDIIKDHPLLIEECLSVLRPKGKLYFSTNHQRFVENFGKLKNVTIKEITADYIPEDYSRQTPFKLWLIERIH
ncbi:MAG: class I SAM-dependent methyltransferase [Pseudomonadota bacterium]